MVSIAPGVALDSDTNRRAPLSCLMELKRHRLRARYVRESCLSYCFVYRGCDVIFCNVRRGWLRCKSGMRLADRMLCDRSCIVASTAGAKDLS